jgi:hypothetical protein
MFNDKKLNPFKMIRFIAKMKYRYLPKIKRLEQQDEKSLVLLKEIYQAYNEIPCLCHKAYKKRGLEDPACPKCNFVYDDILEKIKNYLEEIQINHKE